MTARQLALKLLRLASEEQELDVRVNDWMAVGGVAVKSHHEVQGDNRMPAEVRFVSLEVMGGE